MYSKNWLALDGVLFQSIEQKFEMDEAIELDENTRNKFTMSEAGRIKNFLHLLDRPGIEGLKQALRLRIYANMNRDEIIVKGNVLICRTLDCRVQNARKRKGMELLPTAREYGSPYQVIYGLIGGMMVMALSLQLFLQDDFCKNIGKHTFIRFYNRFISYCQNHCKLRNAQRFRVCRMVDSIYTCYNLDKQIFLLCLRKKQ